MSGMTQKAISRRCRLGQSKKPSLIHHFPRTPFITFFIALLASHFLDDVEASRRNSPSRTPNGFLWMTGPLTGRQRCVLNGARPTLKSADLYARRTGARLQRATLVLMRRLAIMCSSGIVMTNRTRRQSRRWLRFFPSRWDCSLYDTPDVARRFAV